MQTFVRVLAHSENLHGKVHGVLEINGHKLKPRQFGERVAHVSSSELHSGLTLIEYLNIYSSLIQPATNSFKKHETVSLFLIYPFECGLFIKNGTCVSFLFLFDSLFIDGVGKKCKRYHLYIPIVIGKITVVCI